MREDAKDSKESKVRRVWILGAGFSRPLGGPLLRDLLSMRSWRKHSYLYETFFGRDDVRHLYALFTWGTGYPEGTVLNNPTRHPGCRQFMDAEDFLVQLHDMEEPELHGMIYAAYTQSFGDYGSTSIREKMVGKDEYLRLAHKILALECSTFMWPVEQGDERFTPYVRWVEKLTSDDAIITYNYDLVAEQVLLKELDLVGVKTKTAPRGRKIPVCKMHGSCNWFERDSKLGIGLMEDAADPEKPAPVLGIPGKSKASLAKRHRCFKAIESRAQKLLRDATHVYLMGYGLPESDANASRFLLESLQQNRNPHLTIEVILGEPNFRTKRLEATLRQALAHRVHTDGDRQRQRGRLSRIAQVVETLEQERDQWGDFKRSTKVFGLDADLLTVASKEHAERYIEQYEKLYYTTEEAFKDMTLTVLPQYAQDYMQGFATREGGKLK